MPSELGKLIRKNRKRLGLSFREFAKRIGKSPSFAVLLEQDPESPSASEETLRKVAEVLELDPDDVLALAGKIPQDIAPESGLEVSLYRRVKNLSPEEQKRLLRRLDKPKES